MSEEDGNVPCPRCGQRVNRIVMHLKLCKRLNPQYDGKNLIAVTERELFPSDDSDDSSDEENDRKTLCPHCDKRFKRLDMHLLRCQSKTQDEEGITVATKGLSLVDDENEVLPVPKKRYKSAFKNYLENIKLDRNENDRASKINTMMNSIRKELIKCRPLSWKQMNTGSYYSNVKVGRPDEFDYMFYPSKVRCKIVPSAEYPCHCRVYITNKEDLTFDFRNILEPDDELTPSKYQKFIFDVFDVIVKRYSDHLERTKNKRTSPAYTLLKSSNEHKNFTEIDLVPSLEVRKKPESFMEWKSKRLTENDLDDNNLFVVPKKIIKDDKELELWRVSYSTFEKMLLGKYVTDHRYVIRVLKCILGEIKTDDSELCSYHIVTFCLHFFEKYLDEGSPLLEITLNAITSFIDDHLYPKDLPHFFVRGYNLLQDVSSKEIKQYIDRLNCYKEKWRKEVA